MLNNLQSAKRSFASFFTEVAYVSKVYADSLRDNFIGYEPSDQVKFDRLRAEFQAELAGGKPDFAILLGIEAGLVEVLPAPLLKARFWAVEDRFNRVVPACTRDRHAANTKPRGDPIWEDEEFLRGQTRTLLETIHNNYLTNIAREKSIGRLKAILGLAFVVALIVAVIVATSYPSTSGHVLLVVAGTMGAALSIANRLQTAVSRDAMIEDGLAEVFGLRAGWGGVLVSMFLGGGFALVLYGIVMAGMFGLAAPTAEADRQPAVKTSAPGPLAAPPLPAPVAAAPGPDVSTIAPTAAAPGPATLQGVAETSVEPGTPPTAQLAGRDASPHPLTPQVACSAAKEIPCSTTDSLALLLGLRGTTDLFKMLILAFLAGFAERLAPDILGRLSKTATRP